MKNLIYCGIGSRETPKEVCDLMRDIAYELGQSPNWILRSGHADGADKAFEDGCKSVNGIKEIYVPWARFSGSKNDAVDVSSLPNYKEALSIAESFHPNWKACSNTAKSLHTRNVYQIAGRDLNNPADLVICWTVDGKATGGTGQAIRMAESNDIPVFNLKNIGALEQLQEYVYMIEQRG